MAQVDSISKGSNSSSSSSSSSNSFNSSRDRIQAPSSRSADNSNPSGNSRISPRQATKQGINSPNLTPLDKKKLLAKRRQESTEETSKLPTNVIFLMLGTAVFVDVLQWLVLLVAGEYVLGEIINDVLIDPVAELCFIVWFSMRGIKLSKLKSMLTFFGGFIGKEISQGALPLWTLEIIVMIAVNKAEEEAEKVIPGSTHIKE